jgi:hypothetical protein
LLAALGGKDISQDYWRLGVPAVGAPHKWGNGMKWLTYVFGLFLFSSASAESPGLSVTVNSMEEMYRLVEEKSDSRKYFWCSIVSGKLGMEDVRVLFVNKASKSASDSAGFLMAHSYMIGFVDSELMHLGDSDESGAILGQLYSSTCMKELLPKK